MRQSQSESTLPKGSSRFDFTDGDESLLVFWFLVSWIYEGAERLRREKD